MRFVETKIQESKKFLIIKTTDLIDNDFWYGVYEKGNFLDRTMGRLFGIYPLEIESPLTKKEAERIFNNMFNHYEAKRK